MQNKLIWPVILIIAFLPPHLIIPKLPLAETIFLTFYIGHLLGLIIFLKSGKATDLFLAAFLLVLATFTKPTTLYLHLAEFFLLAGYSCYLKITWKKIINLTVIFLLLPSLMYLWWSFNNYRNTGIFVFANVQNYNLLADNFYHLYPYLNSANWSDGYKVNLGDELRLEKGEKLRRFLFGPYLDNFIINSKKIDPENISFNRRVELAGELGVSKILQNIYIYIPIHLAESLMLFTPNYLQTLLPIVGINYKLTLIVLEIFSGAVFLAVFVFALYIFLKRYIGRKGFRNQSEKLTTLLLLLNILYLLAIVGPAAFDDGGRFSFVFLPVVLIFTAGQINYHLGRS